MSFDDTAREADQTFSLNRDLTGELEYPTKYDAGPRAWGLQGAAPPERAQVLRSIQPAGVPLNFRKVLAEDSSFPCISKLPTVELVSLALSCPCQVRALV